MRRYPILLETNARILLRRVSAKHGRTFTIGEIPVEEWRILARKGFDGVWVMGVWKRSPASRSEALSQPDLRRSFVEALQDWTENDAAGSPYAVLDYRLDPALGPEGDLEKLRRGVNEAGLSLFLDFVPNHLARDHAWTRTAPERFVRQGEGPLSLPPDGWFKTPEGLRLAHGRDPNYPPWLDTVQINYFSTEAREAMASELRRVASSCDGIRCDMAMLALSKVFERVWGPLVPGTRPDTEFWSEAIGSVKASRPDFVFLAEAYWGHEWELQQLGFDYTYDKTLYDRLLHAGAGDVLAHLKPDGPYQDHSAHFVENHDEARAAAAFGKERSLAAAAVAATAPGLRLFFDGQLEGRRARLPVQLVREPEEAPDPDVVRFYGKLLEELADPAFHDGRWEALTVLPGRDDGSHTNLLVWRWTLADRRRLVAINYSSQPSNGRVESGAAPLELEPWGVRWF